MRAFLVVALFLLSGQLIAADPPRNSHPNSFGTGWECDRGYYRSGQKCVKVVVPENADIDVYGSGWSCNRGYYRSGNKCVKVIVPENASIDVYGSGWSCNTGYKQRNNACIRMTAEEVQKQKEAEQAIMEKIQKRRAKGPSGDACETEFRTNAEVCVKVTRRNLDCTKSYSGGYYTDCDVTLGYDVETNYSGGSYLDVEVKCRVGIEYTGRGIYSTQSDTSSKDDSHSLYAYGSDSESKRFNFSFSSYQEVTRVITESAKCKIDSVELQ